MYVAENTKEDRLSAFAQDEKLACEGRSNGFQESHLPMPLGISRTLLCFSVFFVSSFEKKLPSDA